MEPLGLLDLKGSWVPWMEPLGLRSLSVPWMGQQAPLVFNVPWMGQAIRVLSLESPFPGSRSHQASASRVQSALDGANDAPGQHVMGMGDGWFHGYMPSQPQQPQMSPFWSPQRRGV